MTKKERQKRDEYRQSRCPFFAMHCKVFHGNECRQLGGRKIPRQWKIDLGTGIPIKTTERITTMKPYFMDPSPTDDASDKAVWT